MDRRFSDNQLSALLLLAASFWGLYWWPLHQIESHGVAGIWSVWLFNLCPLAVLVPWAFIGGRWRGLSMPVVLTGVAMGAAMSLYAGGLSMGSVIRTTLLFYLTPIWSSLIGALWLDERIGAGRAVAIALGLGGMALVLGSAEDTIPLGIGDGLALASGVAWALSAACLKRWPDQSVGLVAAVQFSITASLSFVLGALVLADRWPSADQIAAALPVAALTALLVLLPSVLIISWVAKQLFPGRVGVLMMSEVVVAFVSALWLLPNESLTLLQWLGSALIVTACLVEIAAPARSD